MTIQELMYSYYPHAPKKLLFRESRTRMLVSASLPLANMAFDSDNISVIAHLPLLVNQGNWDLGSQSTSYRFSRDRVYTGIHAEASQPAKAHPVERAEGYHTSFHSAGSSNNACFKRRLSFGSSAAPTPNVSTDSYHSGNCFDANGSSSQDLPQLNFEKALLFREDNQSKETLDRRRDISVQSLSGLYSSSDSREDNKASAPNGCIDQSCNYSSQRLQ
ncbi:hypothetical protein J3B02_000908 [Coemansia erecta]|uniref:Uncharacterized protein n=1 Tax=Coemansia asiatica TaxID=1052880 RepID=A0A9W7XMN2_9FUNG|nr:hypothetical protein LPJ64_002612 [Coemansia asiatica]KAJ2857567.1 hypothetical protein J3B02_000908 [Coemansia erecta]KAJ2887080.1 hypothetical protein FB639_001441 [Coemansia asiatica]